MTSASHSPALADDRLLLRGGRARVGEKLTVHVSVSPCAAMIVSPTFLDPEGKRLCLSRSQASSRQSSLVACGQVFSDALRLSVMPGRAIVRLQLGARSQKTVSSLKVALACRREHLERRRPGHLAHRAGYLAAVVRLA